MTDRAQAVTSGFGSFEDPDDPSAPDVTEYLGPLGENGQRERILFVGWDTTCKARHEKKGIGTFPHEPLLVEGPGGALEPFLTFERSAKREDPCNTYEATICRHCGQLYVIIKEPQ